MAKENRACLSPSGWGHADGVRLSAGSLREKPQGFYVSLQIKQPPEAERVFHALVHNGQVRMPIQQTFWAARFGMLIDQFGTPWTINCAKA